MKKQSISFVAGVILGATAVILYLVAVGRLSTPSPMESSAQSAETHSRAIEPSAVESPPPPPTPPSNFVTNTVAAPEPGSPATAQTGKASDSLGTQSFPTQYLPPELQQALQQYQKSDDPEVRKSLLSDVVSTVDDDTSKQEAAQVLDQMFLLENRTDLKLEILNDLDLIDDPSIIVPLVDAIDASQPKEVRVAAAEALGSLGDSRAIPFLEQFLSDPDPEIQQSAKDALDRLRSE